MTDGDLQASVTAELVWEPQVDSDDIAVFAEDGVVTLRGTVGSVTEKHRAQSAARRARGVSDVSNHLLVRDTDSGRGAGAVLRAVALQAFVLEGRIPRQRRG
ncbi:MAG TPA: BON domain-containing protein [Streptosporangiaceae bacterium]|nr:BON domain-containing protein [Streptosporangiaceae bacterium]